MSRLVEAHERGEYLPAKQGGHEVANYESDDPFLAHGMGGKTNHIIGKVLKVPAGQNGEFSFKGDGNADDTVIARGSEMLVAVDKLVLCWTRWEGGKPADRIAGYIADGFKAPRREELGYLDEETWEKDEFGKGRDPWKLENLLPMKRLATSELLTAFINGKGSPDDAVRHLVLSFGRTDRTKYPVVRLGLELIHQQAERAPQSGFRRCLSPASGCRRRNVAKLETGQPAGARQERRDHQAPLHSGADDPGIPNYIDAGHEDRIPF